MTCIFLDRRTSELTAVKIGYDFYWNCLKKSCKSQRLKNKIAHERFSRLNRSLAYSTCFSDTDLSWREIRSCSAETITITYAGVPWNSSHMSGHDFTLTRAFPLNIALTLSLLVLSLNFTFLLEQINLLLFWVLSYRASHHFKRHNRFLDRIFSRMIFPRGKFRRDTFS